ncbi:MAG: tyrosine-protein phosphatase, partial [Actinomycetota bacterium]
ERWLLDDYLGMLTTGAGQVGAIVRRIAHAGGPVLFHCTGGKDRTGIVAAIVLSAVGVEREVVLDDFELTNRRRGPEHLPDVVAAFVEHGIGREAAAALLRASRPLMATALEVVDEQHGSIGRYLTEACGLDDADLAALTSRLVEAPGPVIG